VTRGLETPGVMWLPISGKTLKGKEPQGRQPCTDLECSAQDGSWTVSLWRGAEGSERVVRKETIFPDTRRRKHLKGRREPRP